MGSGGRDMDCETLLKRIREEIVPVMERSVTDETAVFENPHIPTCRVEKGCDKESCPVFGEEAARCWQIAGTYCGGVIQGKFVEKYEKCSACPVFTDACPTVVEELGEHLNNMLYLLRQEKRRTKDAIHKAEHLNRELTSALENLDARNTEIQEIMITDRLTGLYNRHYLLMMLDDEFSRAARRQYHFALLMIDIDDFKSINDTYGHISGDEMLKRFGEVMRQSIRSSDRAFRYGGEEFVVLLPETDLMMACLVAERIRRAFEREVFSFVAEGELQAQDVSRAVSVGAASVPPSDTLESLIAAADDAMYTAKSEGKNRVVRADLPPPDISQRAAG